jgi:hypothetical protein
VHLIHFATQARACLLAFAVGLVLAACRSAPPAAPPAITVTQVPEAAVGGTDRVRPIAGTVVGALPGDRLVVYARSGVWWVQPTVATPLTTIASDGTWQTTSHPGVEYAALLVRDGYTVHATLDALPQVGDDVRAMQVVAGTGDFATRPRRTLAFSGYEWEVRDAPSDRGGANVYDSRNADVDARGHLHLRLTRRDNRWTGAEVSLTRPLGYGTYVFETADVSGMDPAAVLGLLTWDDGAAQHNHRELDIELSRWGDPRIDNAQYVVQPYYVPANVRRFQAPAGRLAHTFTWSPEHVAFQTTAGAGRAVASHVFTSGVPVPGDERVRMHLYAFGFSATPVRNEVEVVIEKFQYLP